MYNITRNVGGGQRHAALGERHASTNHYLKRSPRLFTRIEHTQHTTHHKTKTTAQHTDNSQPNYSTTSRWKTPTRFLPSRRALRSERAGAPTSFVARSRSCSLVLRLQFFDDTFFCLVCARRSAWPELLQFTTLLPLSRECLRFEGFVLNRVEGQSCCAAVLTTTLRHTEGGRRPRGILHMKRVWGTEHSIFLPGTWRLFWPFVQARTAWTGEGISRSSYPLMLTHEINPLLANYVWISAEYPSLFSSSLMFPRVFF